MVHLIPIMLVTAGLMLVMAFSFAVVRAKKGGTSKVSKILFIGLIIACFVFFMVTLVALFATKHGQVVDVKTTSDHSMVEVDGLSIETRNGLILIMSDGKDIGAYPESTVRNMFELDEDGHIVDQSVRRVNLTVQNSTITNGLNIFGIWVVVESSHYYPVDVILD